MQSIKQNNNPTLDKIKSINGGILELLQLWAKFSFLEKTVLVLLQMLLF